MKNTLLALGALVVLGLGYSIYLDSKLTHTHSKKKKPRKGKKHSSETTDPLPSKLSADIDEESKLNQRSLEIIEELKKENIPISSDEREAYFMKHLELGETLFKKGKSYYEDSAIAFFKAWKVYPSPMDLLMVFQQTTPDAVFNLIISLMSAEVTQKQAEYYSHFPAKNMNTRVEETLYGINPNGKSMVKRNLVATKDIEEGQVLFVETPLFATLISELEGKQNCSFCFRYLPEDSPKTECTECDLVVFCSLSCKLQAEFVHSFLCTKNKLTDNTDLGEKALAISDAAKKLQTFCLTHKVDYPLLIAKFLLQMVEENSLRKAALADLSTMDYTHWDHLERMSYVDKPLSELEKEELELVKDFLAQSSPGLESFLEENRYALVKRKFEYNCVAVTSQEEAEKKLERELVRTDGKKKIIGKGLFHITSFIQHSCTPNVFLEFDGNDKVQVTALQPIKNGEALRHCYIDLSDCDTKEKRENALKSFKLTCSCDVCHPEKHEE